jgi:hypothetical protein
MKSIEGKGNFFLPGNPDRSIPGFFSFHTTKGSQLDLIGCFTSDDSDKFSKLKIINGNIGNKLIALLNNSEIQRTIHLNQKDYTKIYSQYSFLNINFTKYSDLRFKRIRSKILHLSEWTNQSNSFSINHKQFENEILIKYINPPSIDIQLNNDTKLSFVFGYSGLSQGYYMKDISLNQDVYLYIENKRPKSFNFYLQYLEHFQKFLVLATQKDNFHFDTSFGIKPRGQKYMLEIPVMHIQKNYNENPPSVTPKSFLFEYADIQSNVLDMLKSWFLMKDNFELTLSSFFSTYKSRGFGVEEFLNVAKSLEAFHREFIDNKRIAQIERYKVLFERVRKAVNPILKIRSKNKFCEKIRDNRNIYTHNQPSNNLNRSISPTLLLFTEKLKLILIANILLELGITNSEILKLLMNSSCFGYLRK